jgi:hypothetical protein
MIIICFSLHFMYCRILFYEMYTMIGDKAWNSKFNFCTVILTQCIWNKFPQFCRWYFIFMYFLSLFLFHKINSSIVVISGKIFLWTAHILFEVCILWKTHPSNPTHSYQQVLLAAKQVVIDVYVIWCCRSCRSYRVILW